MSTNGAHNQDAQLVLQLANGGALAVETSELVLHESNAVADMKIRRDSDGRQTIPLYNILWAEFENDHLTIDYALLSSNSAFQVEKLIITTKSTVAGTVATGVGENLPNKPRAQKFVTELLSRAYGKAQQKRRAYVLVNPNAGSGKGVRRWERDVKPLFDAARIQMDVVYLKKGGEAAELAQKMDINMYDTIIPCSGDGTPHEVFNGLAKRPDAKKALSEIAVGHIPCGSGNAMSCNLYGSHRPTHAALALIKGVVIPIDLISVTQGDARIISFLSQSLGIVAESDLGTEHLRWMGSARFEFGLISRLFRKKVYPCDIAMQVEAEKPDVKDHYRRHIDVPNIMRSATEEDTTNEKEEGFPRLKYGTIKDDLPKGWELVPYDNIGTFYCGNMTFMTPDVQFFSAALAADGCMDLITMNGDIPTHAALKAFLSVDSNKFFDNPYVHYKKVSAYRIIPRDQKDGYISIDGEKVPFAPFQAEVHQGLGRVISKKGGYEAEGPANWRKTASTTKGLHA